ncbi:GtrA family protein [Ghiorsea bivora]|uniref:GtrA family protein n=1 Tax=Ghiorsea bivora TaxID=1485545 RepID=UPI0012FE7598|nr:GtrA family protein [Ghiorsea bivora]
MSPSVGRFISWSANIKILLLQLSRYGFFGIIATLIHLLSAWLLIYGLSTSVLLANSCAFLIAFMFSYIFQSKYVFKASFDAQKFVRFFAVQSGAFVLAYMSSTWFRLDNQYIQTLLIVMVIPLVSFVIHKLWTFQVK